MENYNSIFNARNQSLDFDICFLFHVWNKKGAESEEKLLILR